jgi:Fe-S cluster assembly iron-binding protein IscA
MITITMKAEETIRELRHDDQGTGTKVDDDDVDRMQGSGFVMQNPQAKTTCGCGSSFRA